MRHLSISGNKSSHLFAFPLRQGIILAKDLPSHLQCSHTEPQPRGDQNLCIHWLVAMVMQHIYHQSFPSNWLCAEVQTLQIRQASTVMKIKLLSEWCHMCKYIEYICVYLLWSCNGTKMIVRHYIILSILKATTWFLRLTVAYFDSMHSGTPANTVTVFGSGK